MMFPFRSENISNLLLTSFEVSVNFYLYSLLYALKEIPPYNGFGSLEDSLQSCLSLVPQPPKKDFIKMLENDNKVLRYEAVLVGCYSTGFCLAILKAQNHFSKENIFLSSICQVYYNCHGDLFFFLKKAWT